MDESRLKEDESGVSVLAVGVYRTKHGNTHTGIAHRDTEDVLRFLEQAFHKLTRNDPVAGSFSNCRGKFLFAMPDLDDERAESIAGLCRLIAENGPAFAYALRYDPAARFDEHNGQLLLPDGRGLSCSTFVLAVFRSARWPLIDFEGWPERETDKQDQENIVQMLKTYCPPPEQAHIAEVENEIGCVRARPEEVAGACLVESPASYLSASEAGVLVVERIDGTSST